MIQNFPVKAHNGKPYKGHAISILLNADPSATRWGTARQWATAGRAVDRDQPGAVIPRHDPRNSNTKPVTYRVWSDRQTLPILAIDAPTVTEQPTIPAEAPVERRGIWQRLRAWVATWRRPAPIVAEEPIIPAEAPIVAEEPAIPAEAPIVAEEPAIPAEAPIVAEEPAIPAEAPIVVEEPTRETGKERVRKALTNATVASPLARPISNKSKATFEFWRDVTAAQSAYAREHGDRWHLHGTDYQLAATPRQFRSAVGSFGTRMRFPSMIKVPPHSFWPAGAIPQALASGLVPRMATFRPALPSCEGFESVGAWAKAHNLTRVGEFYLTAEEMRAHEQGWNVPHTPVEPAPPAPVISISPTAKPARQVRQVRKAPARQVRKTPIRKAA
jgi:hypothetical protein